MKKYKFNWGNLVLILILIVCIGIIIHDLYHFVKSFITGNFVSFTYFGIFTFMGSFIVIGEILDYFKSL